MTSTIDWLAKSEISSLTWLMVLMIDPNIGWLGKSVLFGPILSLRKQLVHQWKQICHGILRRVAVFTGPFHSLLHFKVNGLYWFSLSSSMAKGHLPWLWGHLTHLQMCHFHSLCQLKSDCLSCYYVMLSYVKWLMLILGTFGTFVFMSRLKSDCL